MNSPHAGMSLPSQRHAQPQPRSDRQASPRRSGGRALLHRRRTSRRPPRKPYVDGSAPLLPLATSALSRRTFLNLTPRLERCCSRRQDPMRPVPSQRSLHPLPLSCRRRTSACCCSGASPCAPRTCSCHGRLDQLGDHRSACATSSCFFFLHTPFSACQRSLFAPTGAAA